MGEGADGVSREDTARILQEVARRSSHILQELLRACGEAPRSAADVLALIFRRPLDTQQMFFAMGEAIAHLHALERAGRLRRARGPDGVFRFALIKEEAWEKALTA